VKQLSYRTQFVSKKAHKKEWYIINAENQTVGRMATQIASILSGKHKPSYTPNDDAGDFVIVINSNKCTFTGRKWDQKIYTRHTGYPGGQRMIAAKDLNVKNPIAIIETAVKGMLPKSKLGRAMYKKLFVYAGAEHPHAAQKALEIKIESK
jgi:large subunit ribosomal protein L13